MMINYPEQFPIPATILPPKLRRLLEPVGIDPDFKVEVAIRWDKDQYGPDREYVHMIMAVVPENALASLSVLDETENGVVSDSTPCIDDQGGLSEFIPSVSGYDYIVASWGNGSFYSYALAEKVWMTLGLSCRVLGGEQQKIIYDNLSLPEFGIAEGEITAQYYFSANRNVQWTMNNEYLRRYLWMRGMYGVKVFFYEALLPDNPELRSLMKSNFHEQKEQWYRLIIREHKGRLLIQVWASVIAITPERCPEQTADGLIWPGMKDPMSRDKANTLKSIMTSNIVYLDDKLLERYEQNDFYATTPYKKGNQWRCNPSYRGQWGFSDCVRVGRNLIKVPMRELYKPKPDREILHAHKFALPLSQVETFDLNEEHIVAKTDRFVHQLLDLRDHLSVLGGYLSINFTAEKIVGLSRADIRENGWANYPKLSRLAQVAPLDMTQQAFLSRCKSIHELWQKIPNVFLRNLVMKAGHAKKDLHNWGSLKLLQALLNILERLNSHGESIDAFGASPEPHDLTHENKALAALFINNELRNADAHNASGTLQWLEEIGFDIAGVNQGYGRALDHVFDGVIQGFAHLNSELERLLRT